MASTRLIQEHLKVLTSGKGRKQLEAVRELSRLLAKSDDDGVAIVAAGAVPPLVQIIGSRSEVIQELAVDALLFLTLHGANSGATIVAAGGIPALVSCPLKLPPTGQQLWQLAASQLSCSS
jgi:hypothetical protein